MEGLRKGLNQVSGTGRRKRTTGMTFRGVSLLCSPRTSPLDLDRSIRYSDLSFLLSSYLCVFLFV